MFPADLYEDVIKLLRLAKGGCLKVMQALMDRSNSCYGFDMDQVTNPKSTSKPTQ